MATINVKDAAGATIAVARVPNTGTGVADADRLPVVVSDGGGSVTVDGAVTVNNFPATQPVSGTVAVSNFPATQPVSIAAAVPVTGAFFQATQPVSGTVSVGNFPATQPVSAASLPLPSGAATAALQTTGNTTLASVDGKLPALVGGRIPVELPAGGGGLTNSELRAAPVSVSSLAVSRSASGALTAVTQTVTLDTTGLMGAHVTVTGTFVGTATVEVLRADGTWVSAGNLRVRPYGSGAGNQSAAITTVGAWSFSCPGFASARVRASAWTSGTANIVLEAAEQAVYGAAVIEGVVSIPGLIASVARVGFIGAAGIWYDDSVTPLGTSATFTGVTRDAFQTATATAWANGATYGNEVVASCEQDVSFILWIEVSRDGTTWRKAKAVTSAVVTDGGHYAEIVHRPSWRWWRVVVTNGGTAAARTTINSVMKAA